MGCISVWLQTQRHDAVFEEKEESKCRSWFLAMERDGET